MLQHITSLWASVFYGAVIVFALAELVIPWREQKQSLNRRWSTNIGLYLLNILIQRVAAPLSAVAAAQIALATDVGVLQWLDLPQGAVVVAGVLLLDLWKYVEHRLMHGVPMLWRLHMVHHSDTEVDFTTAERHHPLEVLLGIAGLAAVTYAFGIPALAVVLYALLAAAVAVFSHANVRVRDSLDRILRSVIVTPSVHGVHHSAERVETDSNFGLMMTVWDRALGTYQADSAAKSARRTLGLEYFRDARSGWLDRVLLLPFLSNAERRRSQRLAPVDNGPRRTAP